MMARQKLIDDEGVRVHIIFVLMMALFVFLSLAMYRVQVAHGAAYQENLNKQSVRRVRVPGMRGRIYDRNGVCLADNRPSYCVAVYLEEVRQAGGWSSTTEHVEAIIVQLSSVLGVEPSIDRDAIRAHIRRRLPLPLMLWRDIDEKTLAKFAELTSQVPGVAIHIEAQRIYPLDQLACHTVGYVGRAEIEQEEEVPYHYFLREMAGRSGVESSLDEVLRGEAGGRLVRVDVAGFRHEDLGKKDPRAGSDVLLTLDASIQESLESALGDEPGAGVVLDPRTGDILAMSSKPGFNPNYFVPAISRTLWDTLRNDDDEPLLNRAVAGSYAPGSVFKPVVAMAALENNLLGREAIYSCPGYFQLGKTRFRCWTRGSHGDLTLQEAIERSCNVYFYRVGMHIGHEYIFHMATALGMGSPLGVQLGYESGGLVPNGHWMMETFGHGWRAGDTCNFSIGQGALAVTPLQVASFTATLANGGSVYKPRLVRAIRAPGTGVWREVPPVVVNNMNWNPANIRTVRKGMRDVIMSKKGTGKLARIEGVTFAGKTGTAEYGKKSEGKKRTWMIAFAPYDDPEYAVAMVAENGKTGGVTMAPKMKKLLERLLLDVNPMENEG